MDYQIKTVEVKDLLRFIAGKVKLTHEQAATRLHNLQPEGDGIFTVVKPIEFKAGEVIGIVGKELPKEDLKKVNIEAKSTRAQITEEKFNMDGKPEPDLKKKDKEKAVKAGKKVIDPTA